MSIKNIVNPLPKEDCAKFSIYGLIAEIYRKCPLLGFTFSTIEKREDFNCPTLGISPDNIMYYNPQFLFSKDMTINDQQAVLFHELLHKIDKHFPRMEEILNSMDPPLSYADAKGNDFDKKSKLHFLHQCANIAMDAAINTVVIRKFPGCETLKKIAVTPKSIADMCKLPEKDVEPDREFEYYYSLLMKADEQGKLDKQVVMVSTDGHDVQPGQGDKSDTSNERMKNEQFKDVVRRAAEEQRKFEVSSGIGKDSGSILDAIPDLNVKVKDKELWKNLITRQFGEDRSPETEFTTKVPSRRHEHDPFGKRHLRTRNDVKVIIDTSGSVCDIVDRFLGIVQRACKRYNTNVDVILCHTDVYGVHKNIKDLKSVLKHMKFESGGTDMNRGLQYVNDNYKNPRQTTVIMITDGYTPWDTNLINFKLNVIYTKDHTKLDGVTRWAVIED